MVLVVTVNTFSRPINNRKFVINLSEKIGIRCSSRYSTSISIDRDNKNAASDWRRNGCAGFASASQSLRGPRNGNLCKLCRNVFQSRPFSTSLTAFKQHGNDRKDEIKGNSYELMQFEWIIWPSLIYTIKNWILAKLIIRPYLDRDFTMDSFEKGAKQAMLLVTSLLSKGELDSLCGLVSNEALCEIERNYSKLDSDQRRDLNFASDDIYFTFPYQVGIMLEDADGVQKRLVEITMCFHCLLGSKDIKRLDPSLREIYKYKDRILIINYRFIKEFTKGRESDWTINIVNYFKPAQHL